eukprot:scaffold220883_cov30-Tisochrysis_lutea.AAC.2
MADDNTLLRLVGHVDYGFDSQNLVEFLEAFDRNLTRVGNFLPIAIKDGLTHHLGSEKALRSVCELILWKEWFVNGQASSDACEQSVRALA